MLLSYERKEDERTVYPFSHFFRCLWGMLRPIETLPARTKIPGIVTGDHPNQEVALLIHTLSPCLALASVRRSKAPLSYWALITCSYHTRGKTTSGEWMDDAFSLFYLLCFGVFVFRSPFKLHFCVLCFIYYQLHRFSFNYCFTLSVCVCLCVYCNSFLYSLFSTLAYNYV